MNVVASAVRSRVGLTLIFAVALAVALIAVLRSPNPAPAEVNPSNTLCKGHVKKGKKAADDPDTGYVNYRFACSGPITGFIVQPEKEITEIETEVFALDRTSGAVVGTDAFSCNGSVPGYSINCTGVYGGDWRVVKSRFGINGDPCIEPRADVLLWVTYAQRTSSSVAQYIAGPFSLGRPRGCRKTARSGKTRIPVEVEESTIEAPEAAPAG